jgi:hypothetical protein
MARTGLRELAPGEDPSLHETVTALHAVVMLGSFMHAAPDSEKTAELAAGGLAALTRLPLATVAWYADGPLGSLRVAGRVAGERHVDVDVARDLRRLCAQLPALRPSSVAAADLPASLRDAGVQVLFALPLRVSTECLGFLLAGGDRGSIPQDLTLIQALGAQTSTALYVARLHESEAVRARELGHLAGVLREQGELLARALRLQEELIELVLRGKGASTIVEHLAHRIGAPVWLLDADRHLVAHAAAAKAADRQLPREPELRRVLVSHHAEYEPRFVEMATTAGVEPFLVQSVSTDRENFGYLMVGSTALGPVDRTTFQGGRLVLALRLLIERSVADAEERAGRDLLRDALLHRGGGGTAAALAARLGYEGNGPATVVAVRVRLKDGDRPCADSAVRRVSALVHEEVHGGSRGVSGALGEETVALVRPEAAEACARRIQERVRGALPELQVSVGISDPRSDLSDLGPAHREALAAVALAERCPSSPLHFADLGLHRLLFDVTHVDRVEQHVERWIGSLRRYDAAHHSRLVETLTCFLAGDGQQEVARALSIHQSTLKYRLRRIREILEVDFADADVRFNIELALRLDEGLRTMRRGSPGP